MSKKKSKVETPEDRRKKAKADLAKHLERAGKGEKAPAETGAQAGLKEAKAGKTKNFQKPKAPRTRADGTMSGLAAAVKVLMDSPEPLNRQEITERAMKAGYWAPKGKTPAATLSSAIGREIARKGKASRFLKAARGKFALSR